MPARTLFLVLLLGAVGGALASWALRTPPETGLPSTAPPTRGETDAPDHPLRPGARHAAATNRPRPSRTQDPGPSLLGSPDAAPPDAGSPDTDGPGALTQRLARVEAQLDDLVRRVEALDGGASQAELAALSDEELTARAASLYAFRNFSGTLRAYEMLLARDPDLDVETRSDVLSAVAQCHRALGSPAQADEVFRQVEALHGEGTAGALTARYQRAWLRHAQGDLAGARELMRQVASSESSPRFWRLFSRANAADFSIRLGDTAQARANLEEFRAELQGDDSQTGRRVLTYVDSLLEGLDG